MARVLVCDDSELLRKQIVDILKEEGHHIVGEASNGIKAFELFTQLKPDLVTMDMLMEPDGHEAVKKIIRHDPAAKIIIITSLVDAGGEVVETVKLGGRGFVSKPVDKEKLIKEVNRVVYGK